MSEKVCDQLLDYYNGHLTGDDKENFEKHLQTCAECRAELAEWEEWTEDLAFQVDPIETPDGMKERILHHVLFEKAEEQATDQAPQLMPEKQATDQAPQLSIPEKQEADGIVPVGRQPRKNWILFYSTAAALVISLVGNLVLLFDRENDEPAPKTAEVGKVVNDVALIPVEGEGTGKASFIKTGKKVSMVIQASKLKPLKGDEVYQVWLIKGNKPYRAGSFVASGNGEGAVVFPLDQLKDEEWETVAITLEPDENSQTPKGPMVLKSSL